MTCPYGLDPLAKSNTKKKKKKDSNSIEKSNPSKYTNLEVQLLNRGAKATRYLIRIFWDVGSTFLFV
jgi:hypothetical protein